VYYKKTYVHIREYRGDYPTQTGIALTPTRFLVLLQNMDDINATLARLSEANFTRKIHLGGGVFLSLRGGYNTVSIRHHFIPKNQSIPIPTKKGISLRLREWKALYTQIEEIRNVSSDLVYVAPCYLSGPHLKLTRTVTCKECFPFDS
jgi:hypothetical protein